MPDEIPSGSDPLEPPEMNPSPSAAEASSTGSGAAPASAFIGNPGPAFDAEAAARQPDPEPPAADIRAMPEPAPMWELDRVEQLLTAQGRAVHSLVGVAHEDWVYTEGDLEAIAPPLTSILNRYPATRAAASAGDELALLIGLGGYVMRSWTERRFVLEELAAQRMESEPVDARTAPEGGEGEWSRMGPSGG